MPSQLTNSGFNLAPSALLTVEISLLTVETQGPIWSTKPTSTWIFGCALALHLPFGWFQIDNLRAQINGGYSSASSQLKECDTRY